MQRFFFQHSNLLFDKHNFDLLLFDQVQRVVQELLHSTTYLVATHPDNQVTIINTTSTINTTIVTLITKHHPH